MIQIILTIIIVLAALGFGIYRTVRSLQDPLRGCDECNKNCSGCTLEELKKEIEEKKTRSKK